MDEGSEKSTRTRIERSASEWRRLVAAFEASGLSRAAFCQQRDIAPSTFGKVLRRLRGAPVLKSKTPPAEFLPVAWSTPPAAVDWDVEIQLSAEVVVRVRRR